LPVVSISTFRSISISCKFDLLIDFSSWLVHDIMGKLQGVKLTKELRSILDIVIDLPQPGEDKDLQLTSDDDKSSPSVAVSSSSSPRSMSASSPTFLLQQVQDVKRSLLQPSYNNTTDVKSTLNKHKHDDFLPLSDIQAIKYLINNSSQSDNNKKTQLIHQLETALQTTKLSFQPKPQPTTDPAFTKRLERLRLQDEERSYNNLTTNLKTASSIKDDNITAKSMMYATSVGLNMVVAPITFGIFMYFFAGSIFSRFFDSEIDINDRTSMNQIDIRRVIAGVVSGVFMLFVEMILFVIRSHELDASVRKKSRRKENRANPFGHTRKNAARVYVRDD